MQRYFSVMQRIAMVDGCASLFRMEAAREYKRVVFQQNGGGSNLK